MRMGRFGTPKLTMEDSMVRLSGRGLKSGASRRAFAVGLALAVPAVVLTQPAAAQVLIGTSFDCARAGTGQSIPSLVCQTPALQLVDLHQMQAYYTLRHAQPERLQELRNQFTARIQGLVRECSTEQVRASGSQPACVEQTLRDMRNFWVQQIQQTGNAAALEEIRLNSARFWESQQALRAGGFVQPDAAIDGIYGTGTRQAIVRFQTERGMQAHGFLTSAMADALRGLFPAGGAAASSGAQQQRTAAPNQTSQVSRPQENSRAVEGTLERLRQQQREHDPLAQQQSTRERQSSGQTSGAGFPHTEQNLVRTQQLIIPNNTNSHYSEILTYAAIFLIFVAISFFGWKSYQLSKKCPKCDSEWSWEVVSSIDEPRSTFQKSERTGESRIGGDHAGYIYTVTTVEVGLRTEEFACKKCGHEATKRSSYQKSISSHSETR